MNFLYLVIISPIETVVDWVFTFIINKIASVGVIGAVLGVSLAINFLALPLYNIADSLQEKERRIAKSLEYRVKRIKMAFKGDEQFMMLSTYYRQNNYHPLYVLRSSLSILIEIPFFIAAFHYLSHNEMLSGAKWWIFQDLGSPDEFFSIKIASFSLGIHILPIIMTLINFVSGAIYTKDATFREKAQLYVVATIFLVLLYNSPSGLVIYWILNNIFSLIKNIVMKMKKPERVLHLALSVIFAMLAIFICTRHGSFIKKTAVVIFALTIFILPFAISFIKQKFAKFEKVNINLPKNYSLLLFSGLGLAILCGFTLPANILASSPVEFSFLGSTDSPISYIWSSFFVFVGFFVFWPTAIYKMFGDKVKKVISPLFFVLFACALANVYIFKHNYGNMNVSFTLDNGDVLKKVNAFNSILPIFFFFAFAVLFFVVLKIKKLQLLSMVCFSMCLAEVGLGFVKANYTNEKYLEHAQNRQKNGNEVFSETDKIEPIYHLSKTGKNVIVLFLDRAINSYFAKFFEMFPEYKKSFDGFVYYPNTLSFSTHTSIASPAMLGGYEYSPENINLRSEEFLRDKHNEALLVMPKLFLDAGFSVTVTDPPWSNYAHEGDFTPYEKFPEINAFRTFGSYTNLYFKEAEIPGGQDLSIADVICRKEIRNFSVVQIMYPAFRSTFYKLCRANNLKDDRNYYDIFSSLYFLDKTTDFTSEKDSFIFIDNDSPHEPHALTNDYKQISGEVVNLEKSHLDVNIASFEQVAKFLDFLKKNGVYDNTRIVIVSDHGNSLKLDEFKSHSESGINAAAYNPLFAVKDFNSNFELKIDNSFMTNADTLFEAKKNLSVSNENYFTKKEFVQNKENGINVYPLANGEHHADQILKKKQFTLDESYAFHVSSDISKKENWIPLSKWKQSLNGGSE